MQVSEEQWDDLKTTWEAIEHFFIRAPWCFEDMLTPEGVVAYHKTKCFMDGEPYRPEDWEDEDEDE